MTDFFADLEREIRDAHPRRSRPVVPVKGLAIAAAAAMTLAAVVLALGTLSAPAERERVASPPQQQEEGWTAYPQACEGTVVDGRIPDELLDRFSILRGDAAEVKLPKSSITAEVIRQSVREVEGPQGMRYFVAVARLGDEDCEPGPAAICLISPSSNFCTLLGEEPLTGYVIDELPGGRRVVAVIAEDEVPRVEVSIDGRGVVAELGMKANTAFRVMPEGDDVRVTPAGEMTPVGCSNEPAMTFLKERLAIFRRAADSPPRGFAPELPDGWELPFLDHARVAGDYVVFPAADGECATGVCIALADGGRAECMHPQDGEAVQLMYVRRPEGGGRIPVAGLARDGVRSVRVTSGGSTQEVPVRGSFFSFVAQEDEFEVEPGS